MGKPLSKKVVAAVLERDGGHSMAGAYIRPDTGMRMCRECANLRRRLDSGNIKKAA